MFASRFYPDRYFTPRYWPKIGAASTVVADGICMAVEMFPAIQQAVTMMGAIEQAVDMRPAIQQTASMGCMDCG